MIPLHRLVSRTICPQHVISFLATNRLGAIHVPANVMYGPDELRYIFKDAGIRLVITLDLFFENVKAAAADTAMEKIVVTGIDEFLGFPKNRLYRIKSRLDGSRPRVTFDNDTLRFADLLKTSVPAPAFGLADFRRFRGTGAPGHPGPLA
jgi:long-chain acyl-CoA synthetase